MIAKKVGGMKHHSPLGGAMLNMFHYLGDIGGKSDHLLLLQVRKINCKGVTYYPLA